MNNLPKYNTVEQLIEIFLELGFGMFSVFCIEVDVGF